MLISHIMVMKDANMSDRFWPELASLYDMADFRYVQPLFVGYCLTRPCGLVW